MKIRIVGLVLVLLFAALLLTFNLRGWPPTWYDEGITLQVAKNLALSNKYGIQSSDGFREFDPVISTGPTVTLPIALLFKLGGLDLLWGRLVIVIYALLLTALFFTISDSIFDTNTAIVASLFLITLTASFDDISGSFIALARMVMGEVPALLFSLAGVLFWFRGIETNKKMLLAGAGLCFGLAFLTKQQHYLMLPAIITIFLIDRVTHHRLRISHIGIPIAVSLVCVFIWYAVQALIVDTGTLGNTGIMDRLGTHITIFSPELIVRSIRTLLGSGILIWGLPGLIYGAYLSKDESITDFKRMSLITICVVWLIWFVFGSIGWIRYAFPAIMILMIFIAKLLVDLSNKFEFFRWLFHKEARREFEGIRVVQSLSVTLAILFMILVPVNARIKDLVTTKDISASEFARFIDENISQEAIIETFEPEIAFFSRNTFHQPPFEVDGASIRHVQFGEPYPDGFYDLKSYNLDYLVLGPHAKWTRVYSRFLQNTDYELVHSTGEYDLIRIK
jgi:4-amino-4-deoxy-L-arabinose transferase-like glycosyltransferase